MSKPFIVPFVMVVVYIFIGAAFYNLGKKHGVDNYHQACYTVGGIVVDENAGTAIQCAPFGKVPKEELPNFFPKGVDKTV